jgi:O-methyltransferase involved in polyketide biosynthesis
MAQDWMTGEPDLSEIDTTVAHAARVYDYLVGGKDNYQVDRVAAERAYANYPGGMHGMRRVCLAQRAFLDRSVSGLARQGVRQFLDIGTGIPTANNTHEVAQRVAPESRVVYVDNDPIVLAHARALLRAATPEGFVTYIDADLRNTDSILEQAATMLDFTQPIAVSLIGILHFLDNDQAYKTVRRLMKPMPAGSHLTVAHLASDVLPEEMAEAARSLSKDMTDRVHIRTRDEVAGFFDGLTLLEPGVVQVHRWRPDAGDQDIDTEFPDHVGVARKDS